MENDKKILVGNVSVRDFLGAFLPEQNGKILLRAFEPANAPKQFDLHGKPKKTTRSYETTLADLIQLNTELSELNNTHGVYFVVNSGGNSDKEITRYNAAFVENDNLPIEQQHKNLNDAPILPSIRVETNKSVHAYWLIDGECSEKDWREVQNRLIAYFDGDNKIKNPSRAMRLPHFNHVSFDETAKTYNYKRVEIADFKPEKHYTVKELLGAFPEVPQPEIKTEKVNADLQNGEMPEWYKELQEVIQQRIYNRVKDGFTFKCPAHSGEAPDSAILFSNGNIFCRSKDCSPEQMAKAFGIDVDAYRKNYVQRKEQKNKIDFNSQREDFMAVEEENNDSLNSLNSSEKGQQENVTNRALHGLAGEIVKAIEPHTEADSMALLLNTLVAFGNIIGRKAFFEADGSQHYTNLYGVLVGTTSAGKGTSWSQIRRLFDAVDSDWSAQRIKSGLSSGEGLIFAVSDENTKEDKRLLIVESEFSSVLLMKSRDGNILSPIIRGMWDTGTAQTLTKNTPLLATDAHIAIIGHITPDELDRCLDNTQIANGFANRFLWVRVNRSKSLPNGGKLSTDEHKRLVIKLREAIEFAQTVGEMKRDEEAENLWIRNYPMLTAERTGRFGNVTTRARAQVVRLSLIYALMDKSAIIKLEHLRAAIAFWQYCENSALRIFGDKTGNDDFDKLIKNLKNAPEQKLSRTAISRDVFGGNKSAEQLRLIYSLAAERNLIHQFTEGEGKEATEYLQLIQTNYELDEVDEQKAYKAAS